MFGARVTKNVVDIKEYQVKKFLRAEILKVGTLPKIEKGFVIIRFKKLPIAIGKYNGSEIRSTVRRDRRLP
jgi:NOL1/NOP2/fmu family ribosome biogenesis protein